MVLAGARPAQGHHSSLAVVPAKKQRWIPAYAGMTKKITFNLTEAQFLGLEPRLVPNPRAALPATYSLLLSDSSPVTSSAHTKPAPPPGEHPGYRDRSPPQ